jgi:hypothetical protein
MARWVIDNVMEIADQLSDHAAEAERLGRADDTLCSTRGRPAGWGIEFGSDGMKVDKMYYAAEEITANSDWRQDWSGNQPLAAM